MQPIALEILRCTLTLFANLTCGVAVGWLPCGCWVWMRKTMLSAADCLYYCRCGGLIVSWCRAIQRYMKCMCISMLLKSERLIACELALGSTWLSLIKKSWLYGWLHYERDIGWSYWAFGGRIFRSLREVSLIMMWARFLIQPSMNAKLTMDRDKSILKNEF